MRMYKYSKSCLLASVTFCILTGQASAQSSTQVKNDVSSGAGTASTDTSEIIVTAQKRRESINKVGMTIAAISGDSLSERNIQSTAELTKVVPGFNYTPTATSGPVYLLRGVGLFDAGLASSPAVTVYLDEVALSSPVMTEVAPIDLERVEVLKGPQGTIFGQNSTGGAVNYIAAKPTDKFEAGLEVGYARFNQSTISGFVSGPLSDTVKARLSVGAVNGGAWQYSMTRPGDEIGATRSAQARLLVDWDAASNLKIKLNVNGWIDNSDTQAGQVIAIVPTNPAVTKPAFYNTPIAPADDRAADWGASEPLNQRDHFFQASLRADWDVTHDVTVTSLSSYSYVAQDKYNSSTGVAFSALTTAPAAVNDIQGGGYTQGHVREFYQEVRVSGKPRNLNWLVGVNYDHQSALDTTKYLQGSTISDPLGNGAFAADAESTTSTVESYAAFGNTGYDLTSRLNAHIGLRWTKSIRHADSCEYDWDPSLDNNGLARIFTILGGLLGGPGTPIAPMGCVSLSSTLVPGPIVNGLNESNVSWRVGLDYKLNNGGLLYLSASQGYKSGIISPQPASFQAQYHPATQEKLLAYEFGIKTPLFDRRVHLTAAAFYYNYADKQVEGTFIDPTFGALGALINVPKSRVLGVEGSLLLQPIKGLDLSANATYVNSKVLGTFINSNIQGHTGDFGGSLLPYTPQFEAVADGQYKWDVGRSVMAFVGSSLTYHSGTNSTFVTPSVPAPLSVIPAYALLDVRAGIESHDANWRLTFWGKNVTNKYYVLTAFAFPDVISRYAGRPETYGATLSLKFR